MIITHSLFVRIIWTSRFLVLCLLLLLVSTNTFGQLYFNHTYTFKDTVDASPTHFIEVESAAIFEINGLVTFRGENLNEIDVRANFGFLKEDSTVGLHGEYMDLIFHCLSSNYELIMGNGPYYLQLELDSTGSINEFKSVRSVSVEEKIIANLKTCAFDEIKYSLKYMNYDGILLVFRRTQRKIGEQTITKPLELNTEIEEAEQNEQVHKKKRSCFLFDRKTKSN